MGLTQGILEIFASLWEELRSLAGLTAKNSALIMRAILLPDEIKFDRDLKGQRFIFREAGSASRRHLTSSKCILSQKAMMESLMGIVKRFCPSSVDLVFHFRDPFHHHFADGMTPLQPQATVVGTVGTTNYSYAERCRESNLARLNDAATHDRRVLTVVTNSPALQRGLREPWL